MSNINRDLKCKDCKFSKANFFDRLINFRAGFRCTIKEAYREEEFDPVTGKTTSGYFAYCSSMRINEACGPRAKAWSPRSKKLLFLTFQKDQGTVETMFIAIIHFCVAKHCAMISTVKPFGTIDRCKVELNIMEKDLKTRGVDGKIDGRCAKIIIQDKV